MPTPMQLNHPDISSDMIPEIDGVIAAYYKTDGAVIPVLRLCQDIVGYLPMALIDYISYGLNLPRSEVLGVVTFYSLFSLIPKGRHTIKACLGTACYVKGIKEVMTRISNEFNVKEGETTADRRFSLEAVRCLGACGLAPVVVVDQDTHGDVSASQVKSLLENYE
jgi:NADH:ubiquinone oxidoreductase subunit E